MVFVTTCEICGTAIELDGDQPHRCPMHTEQQLKNKAKRDLELNTVDYLIEKYGDSLNMGFHNMK